MQNSTEIATEIAYFGFDMRYAIFYPRNQVNLDFVQLSREHIHGRALSLHIR